MKLSQRLLTCPSCGLDTDSPFGHAYLCFGPLRLNPLIDAAWAYLQEHGTESETGKALAAAFAELNGNGCRLPWSVI
jgi:hypothetical protein